MKRRGLLTGLVVVIALSAAAPAAMAEDFCVGVSLPRCPTATYSLSTSGILSAEDAADADPGADSVVIAPHVFSLIEPLNLVPAADTTIVGAGTGQTIFQGAYPGQSLLAFNGELGSKASGFTVRVNAPAANGVGLSVMSTDVSDFAVEKLEDFPSNSAGFSGLELGFGGTAHKGTVTIGTFAGTGILADYKSGTAYDVEVRTSTPTSSGTGISVSSSQSGTELNFHHMKIKGFASGLGVADKKVTLTDSLIDLGAASNAVGVGAAAFDGKTIELNVERVTIVGSGTDQTGLSLYSADVPSNLDAAVHDIVAYVPQPGAATFSAFDCWGASGVTQTAFLDLGSLATIGGQWQIDPGCSWNFEGPKLTDLGLVDPGFRNEAAGDFRLLRNSPLVDKGSTAGALADTDRDLSGGKRAVDGDGDGSIKTDLGAFEYQRTPPSVAIQPGRTTVARGEEVTFSAVAADPEDESVVLFWDFGDGATADHLAIARHTYTASGTFVAKVTAVDDSGASATAAVTINVLPDREPAAIARIAAKPKKSFAAGKKGFSVAKKGQPSFSVKFAGAATAKFALKRFKGRKLAAVKGTQTIRVKDGTMKFFFGGKNLKPGKYRVTITPLSPSGVAGKPVATDITLK